MSGKTNRRTFLKGSVMTSAAIALASRAGETDAQNAANKPVTPSDALSRGKIGHLSVSRVLLGGNLLTHYTHSRDLQYVYNLTAH